MKINIKHVAKLANILLEEKEEKKLEKQLAGILNYIDKLNSKNTNNVKITSQITGLENVIREDKTAKPLKQFEALSNAKNKYKGLFKIKKIL